MHQACGIASASAVYKPTFPYSLQRYHRIRTNYSLSGSFDSRAYACCGLKGYYFFQRRISNLWISAKSPALRRTRQSWRGWSWCSIGFMLFLHSIPKRRCLWAAGSALRWSFRWWRPFRWALFTLNPSMFSELAFVRIVDFIRCFQRRSAWRNWCLCFLHLPCFSEKFRQATLVEGRLNSLLDQPAHRQNKNRLGYDSLSNSV